MTTGSAEPDDPIDALEDLSDALAELVAAVRHVVEAGSTVMENPEAREAVATALTFAIDAVTGAVAGAAFDTES